MNRTKKNHLNVMPTGIFTFTLVLLLQMLCSVTTAREIVGMSFAASNDQCYVWYDDFTVSEGATSNLKDYHSVYVYEVSRGKSVKNILSISIDVDDYVYTWYDDGTVSVGTIFDLDDFRPPHRYTLPSGKSVEDIVSISIGSNDRVYTWYKGGTMSVGYPEDLDAYGSLYAYELPQGKSENNFVGIGIADSDDYVYAWYDEPNTSSESDRFDNDIHPRSHREYPRPHQYRDGYPQTYDNNSYYQPFTFLENSPFRVSLANNINSTTSDFAPSFYKNQLMFSTFRTGNGNDNGGLNQIYISTRSGTQLASPQPLRQGYWTRFNETDPSFTESGRQVAYVRNNDNFNSYTGSSTRSDIYFSDVVSQNSWQNEVPFPYNSSQHSNGYPHLTPLGDMLYFASDMPGGYGGFDIYVCQKTGNTWSQPFNLGPQVNTSDDEISPFLTGTTLYLASDRRGGYGGFDIFKSTYGNSQWQQIVNMGQGINSPSDDYDFIYQPNQKIAYFTSNRSGGYGSDDIYQAVEQTFTAPSNDVSFIQPTQSQTTSTRNLTVTTPSRMALMIRDKNTKMPLEGVRIDLSACGERAYITDDFGLAMLDWFDENCNIRISKNGYITGTYRFPMTERHRIELTPATTTTVVNTTSTPPPSRRIVVPQNTTVVSAAPNVISRSISNSNTVAAYDTYSSNEVSNRQGYEVQIGAFYTPRREAFRIFENLGSVYYDTKSSGLEIYKVGPFATYQEAERVKAIVRNNGYSDAFVRDASRTLSATPPRATTTTYRSLSVPAVTYRVQIGVFQNPNNARFNQQLYNSNMKQATRSDGLTVFFLGDFYSMQEAIAAQENARRLGVTQAFTVEYRNGVKVQ